MKTTILLALLILTACTEDKSNRTIDSVKDQNESGEPISEPDKNPEIITLKSNVNSFKTIEQYGQISNKSQLYEIFGEDNIQRDTIWYAEGVYPVECSILINPTDSMQLTFYWTAETDPELAILDYIRVSHRIYDSEMNITRKQTIHSEEGLYTGMSCANMEIWNEAPFKFNGFDWQNSGEVNSNPDSKLEMGHVDVILDLDYEDVLLCKGLWGEITLMSDDNIVRDANIYIDQLIYFPI